MAYNRSGLPYELSETLRDEFGIEIVGAYTSRGSKIVDFYCFDNAIECITHIQLQNKYHRYIITKKSDNYYSCSFQPLHLKTYK